MNKTCGGSTGDASRHVPAAARNIPAAAFGLALSLGCAWMLCGCATPRTPPPSSKQSDDPACRELRAQIDHDRKAIRAAPTLSSTPIIQQAAEAKADNNIEISQARYVELGCDQDAPPPPSAPGVEPQSSVPPVPAHP